MESEVNVTGKKVREYNIIEAIHWGKDTWPKSEKKI